MVRAGIRRILLVPDPASSDSRFWTRLASWKGRAALLAGVVAAVAAMLTEAQRIATSSGGAARSPTKTLATMTLSDYQTDATFGCYLSYLELVGARPNEQYQPEMLERPVCSW